MSEETKKGLFDVMDRLFWRNSIYATMLLPMIPLLSAYRERIFIDEEKEFECSNWKLIKVHYQSWYEKLKYYSGYKQKRQIHESTH